jgi:hypothetical protein
VINHSAFSVFSVLLSCLFLLPTFSIKTPAKTSLSRPFAGTVRLGTVQFNPTTIGAQNQVSILQVGIETTSEVPSTAQATVEVTEQSNFGNVGYQISGGRTKTVNLHGGGQSTTVSFRFTTNVENQNGRTIVSRVTLTNITGATKGTPDMQSNLNLTVNSPPLR